MANELRADIVQFANDTIERDLIRQSATVLDVYVDGTNGSDTNSGLTANTALATIQRVYELFPLHNHQGGGIRVNLAGVGGFGANATAQLDYDLYALLVGSESDGWSGNTYSYLAPEMVAFSPATGPATAALDAVPTVAVAGGSASAGGTLSTRFDFTVAAPGWTVNDLAGKAFLRVTRAGVKVTWELPIASNTADTITVRVVGIHGLIQNTDTVELVIPAVRFVNSAPNAVNTVAIRGRGNVLDYYSDAGTGPTFLRCAWAGFYLKGREMTFDRCLLGSDASGTYADEAGADFFNCMANWCYFWSFHGTSWRMPPTETSPTDPIVANRTKFMTLQVASDTWANLDLGGQNGETTFLNPHGLAVDGPAAKIDVYYQGLLACMNIGGGLPAGTIQGIGTGGAGYGIDAADGGRAIVLSNSTPGRTSIYRSAGGDPLSLSDAGVTCDYGTGVGDFEEAAGYDGCFWVAPAAGAPADPTCYVRTV